MAERDKAKYQIIKRRNSQIHNQNVRGFKNISFRYIYYEYRTFEKHD